MKNFVCKVLHWRQLPLLALLSTVAFALLLGLPAFAAATQSDVPISFTTTNPCNGEIVPLSGELHTVTNTHSDNNGGFHVLIHQNIELSGTGSLGNQYVANGHLNEEFNAQVAVEQTVSSSFDVISKGSAPNFLEHALFHFTVNANGTVTSSVDNFSAECRG